VGGVVDADLRSVKVGHLVVVGRDKSSLNLWTSQDYQAGCCNLQLATRVESTRLHRLASD